MLPLQVFFNKLIQSIDGIFGKKEISIVLFVAAVIFFLTVRIGCLLSYPYAVNDQLLENDDSMAYLLKAESLVQDPWMQSHTFTTYQAAIKRDTRESAMAGKYKTCMTVRYHLLWSSTVAFLHHIIGVEYETIQWFLCFAGQICILLTFMFILRALNFTINESAVAIVFYSLILIRVKVAIHMPPREWAVTAFLLIIGYVLSIGHKHINKRKIIAIICCGIFGTLMHPRFVLLLPMIYLFLLVYYILKTDMRNDIIKCGLAIGIPVVLIIIVERALASHGFQFLPFSTPFTPDSNISTLSWSLFWFNLKGGVYILKNLLDGMSIQVFDGLILVIIGLVVVCLSQKRLVLFSVCLLIVSTMALFLNYHKAYPAQYFYMFNSVYAVVIILYATKGFGFLLNVCKKR